MPSLLFRSRSLPARLLVALIVGLVAAPGLIAPAMAADGPTGHVSGVIRDEGGNVVSKARVRLLDPTLEAEIVSDTTGTGGRYSLDAPAGVYDLAVTAGPSAAPYTAVIRDVTVGDGDTTFDLIVVRQTPVTLTGRVLDASGSPFPFQVRVTLGGRSVNTAADGSFQLQAPPNNQYHLSVWGNHGRSVPEDPEASIETDHLQLRPVLGPHARSHHPDRPARRHGQNRQR